MTRTSAPVTHVAQEPDHTIGPAGAHQHDLVAEEDLQGHEDEDLTGAADHFVPHSEQKSVGPILAPNSQSKTFAGLKTRLVGQFLSVTLA